MTLAYYNEHDIYAAQWLRNLIATGHIAPGIVDERDIRDVTPAELDGFDQCHFFAGIGIWSHALRRAGWSDDRPIWTGSCPCQPFSAAGRSGGFDDERHLWPHWFWLIEQCRPPVVVGEQVASKDGLGWLDLVSADMEGAHYALGASDLCAAGFGGAHIRQRLYFVGVADGDSGRQPSGREIRPVRAEHDNEHGGPASRLDDDDDARPQGYAGDAAALPGREVAGSRPVAATGVSGGLADTASGISGDRDAQRGRKHGLFPQDASVLREGNSGPQPDAAGGLGACAPMLGRNLADWLFCRDGKWRPVEPGTFPLAHGVAARMDKLRAYGNGLDAETATGFCEVVKEITDKAVQAGAGEPTGG